MRFPHMKLRERGVLRQDILGILEANSRNPIEARGDLLSLVSCNDVGCRRLAAMMAEFQIETIDALAAFILERSRQATVEAIATLPQGRFEHTMELDGFDFPVILKAAMTVEADRITIDYAGSSMASRYGINSPKCYTDAYTIFGLKCVIAPKIPNNAGSLAPFRVEAEPGSIVHPQDPSPVTARHVIGQMLPDVAMGCLAAALPGSAPAESAGSMWVLAMASAHGRVDPSALEGASRFNLMNVAIGGIGARPGKDGISATAFPSGVGVIPIEVTESQSPLVFWRKELACDSGGAGAVRGGLGQVFEIGSREAAPFTISAATFDRTRHPARGRDGGRPGAVGSARLSNGEELVGKGVHVVPAGARLIIETPGGGGLGDPRGRDPEALRRDLEAGPGEPRARRIGLRAGGAMTEVAHACTTLVEVDAGKAFAFLADPKALGGWALGCWDAIGRPYRPLLRGIPVLGRGDLGPGRGRPCAPRDRLSGRQPAGQARATDQRAGGAGTGDRTRRRTSA